ncbi:patatin-like phospholipase family protein [Actinokineospora sp. NBRC 105648]|uniref:patatin-like phospholipase family protein n=1 Tax=Actinokineospora sp. NBRC 105648 TaxID=3032206 RepID=UPI0024A1E55A|nr:patatin-like phospholipase family protein [Actinokineospora sp. NBRC 105648]GLZ36949.1 patatin [Actinokineospora sp. NBRC 105648]
MTEALVLGGGGLGGIAWMTGVLTGLADSGRDATTADLVIGTSAGATLAAQLGTALTELYERQANPAAQNPEIAAEVDLDTYAATMTEILSAGKGYTELRQAIGAFALHAATVSEKDRLAVVESRLPSPRWPATETRIVAVDAETGQPRVFDAASGVRLADAVAASCAVPGVWPPVTIEGRRYVDGGVRSNENADYAAGADRVLILAPLGRTALMPTEKPLDAVLAELRSAGAVVAVVEPDAASVAAVGANPLDPATRGPAVEAGRAQGKRLEIDWS